MNNYRSRVIDALLKRKLAGKGAALIKDPKYSKMGIEYILCR